MKKYDTIQKGSQEKTAVNLQGHNKINGDFGQISEKKTMCRSYSPLNHVVKRGLN